MYNDFTVVGPADDPAHIAGLRNVVAAFKKNAEARATFLSRDDQSGTNDEELRLWAYAGIDAKQPGQRLVPHHRLGHRCYAQHRLRDRRLPSAPGLRSDDPIKGTPARASGRVCIFWSTHHSRLRHETDANYGTVFTLWDMLLGVLPATQDSLEFGLDAFRSSEISAATMVAEPTRARAARLIQVRAPVAYASGARRNLPNSRSGVFLSALPLSH